MLTTTLLTTTALLATGTTALQLSTSTTFKLVASVLTGDLTPSLQSHELTPWTIDHGICRYAAHLAAPGSGSLWFANGTTSIIALPTVDPAVSDFPSTAGIRVTPGGTATVPALFPVTVECGLGSEGVVVKIDAEGVPVLRYGDTEGYTGAKSGWMGCPAEQLGLSTVNGAALAYRAEGQRRLEVCAEVSLVAVCAEGEAGEGAVEVPCVVEDEY